MIYLKPESMADLMNASAKIQGVLEDNDLESYPALKEELESAMYSLDIVIESTGVNFNL